MAECAIHQEPSVCNSSDAIAAGAYTVPDAAITAIQTVTIHELTNHVTSLSSSLQNLASLGFRFDG